MKQGEIFDELKDVYIDCDHHIFVIDFWSAANNHYMWNGEILCFSQHITKSDCHQVMIMKLYGYIPILILFDGESDVMWFCDMAHFEETRIFEWKKREFRHKLPNNCVYYGSFVLDDCVHFIGEYVDSNGHTESFHIQMSIIQLFPKKIKNKYVDPVIYGYLRETVGKCHLRQLLPIDICKLIYHWTF